MLGWLMAVARHLWYFSVTDCSSACVAVVIALKDSSFLHFCFLLLLYYFVYNSQLMLSIKDKVS